MAKQSSITYERVKQAAETLRAEGRQVSVRGVRKELGEGSFATINPLLNRVKDGWRQEAETAAKLAAGNFPADLATAYHQNVEREREALRKDLLQEIEDLRLQVDEAAEAFCEAQETIETLQAQLEAERSDAAEKNRAFEIAAARQAERMESTQETLNQTREDRDGLLRERETLTLERARLQHDLDEAKMAAREARERAERAEAQGADLRSEMSEHRERTAVAEQHAKDTERSCAALQEQLQTVLADFKELRVEHKELTSRLLDAQTALVEARQQGPAAKARMAEERSQATREDGDEPPAHPTGSGNREGKKTRASAGS